MDPRGLPGVQATRLRAGVDESIDVVSQEPALDRASIEQMLPRSIRVDHGTEVTSKALDEWVWKNARQLDFVRPGKSTENGMIESSNGRLRDECLNCNEFESLADARSRIGAWRTDYNHQRPHGALAHLTPKEFVELHQPAEAKKLLNSS